MAMDVLEERPVNLPVALANITLAPEAPIPIYEQIERAIRSSIARGDLPVGTLLPTSRELAQALGVGRNTVVAAYSRLSAEGYVHSKFRRGTKIAPLPQTTNLTGGQELTSTPERDEAEASIRLSYQGQRNLEA